MYFKEWDKLHVHVYKKGSENELQIRVCSLARKLTFVFMNKILKHQNYEIFIMQTKSDSE